MQYTRFYKTLGIPENASESEIRKAYRKLVKIYHPDVNKSSAAANKFIAINEAYEILIGKRENPTQSNPTSRSSSPSQQQTKEQRVKEAQQRYKDQQYKEHIENERYFQSITTGKKWTFLKYTSVLSAIMGIFLIVDLLLPKHFNQDRVMQYSLNNSHSLGGELVRNIITKNEDSYWIAHLDAELYSTSPDIWISKSWIFHNPNEIYSFQGDFFKIYPVHFNIYRYSIVLALLFLVPLFTIYYKRKNILFTFLYYISLYGVNIILMLLLFSNDRWAHLLTLGFI